VVLLCLTISAGVAWRFAPLGLPAAAWKYGGSALWATAVYWLVAAVLVAWRSSRLAFLAAAIAFGVECLKRLYWPPLDRFRETLAGKLLLGRYYTRGAIVAYWCAILCVGLMDGWLRARAARAALTDGRIACNQGHAI
jgi:hypothetical protein